MGTQVATYEPANYFLREETYEGKHLFFYEVKDYPQLKVLEDNWQVIRDEFAGLISGKEKFDVKNINPPYLSSPDAWKNYYFYNFGWKKHKNCERFPKTHALLMRVPNLIFAGVTVLEPHSKVLPHNGETNTTIRCHLGLKIPAPYPDCGVRVGGEERGWEDGKILMFSDAHYHTTWNNTDERRFVLVFDIIRDEYAANKTMVCAKVLGGLSLKYFYGKNPRLKQIPLPLIQLCHVLFTAFWFLYLPLQHRFRLP
jgi:aspartyl/asparaginyl beta-hydroxylase (cupin superfamily)